MIGGNPVGGFAVAEATTGALMMMARTMVRVALRGGATVGVAVAGRAAAMVKGRPALGPLAGLLGRGTSRVMSQAGLVALTNLAGRTFSRVSGQGVLGRLLAMAGRTLTGMRTTATLLARTWTRGRTRTRVAGQAGISGTLYAVTLATLYTDPPMAAGVMRGSAVVVAGRIRPTLVVISVFRGA